MTRRRRAAAAVSIKDVSKALNVSASTVSRVLNSHPDVSEEMRARVMEVADKLGYRPDFLAQSLRGGYTRTVGFVLRDLANPIFADIVKGAERTLRQAGYAMILTNSDGMPDLDVRNVRVLTQRRVDGLLLSLQSEVTSELATVLVKADVPIVLIDREVAGVNTSIVRCDHQRGVRDALDHLIDLGHERIAFISGPREVLATRERLLAFRSTLEERGLQHENDLLRFGSYGRDFGYEQTLHLMGKAEKPTALLSSSVQLTEGVVAACHDLRIRLGHDLSLVSCDSVEFMSYMDPPMSVIRRDAALIGRLTAELMIEMVVDERPPRQTIVPTEYIARGTSLPPPA